MNPILELLSFTSKQMQMAEFSFDQIETSIDGCIVKLRQLENSK
ncbi:hypothetical protein EZS27_018638 [termite gut metagenome]|uniref:Uncharacterized protein n=1 Tax=termite gut metagenome TaxID=433724 RepID=A0A5J4RFU7_9ZZZZ